MITTISLLPSDWQTQQQTATYQALWCSHSQVNSYIETHTFRPGFRLVRQTLNSQHPIWHPPFSDIDYIGLCFAFCTANAKDLALSHLFHQDMNITSGYRFDGGINHATNQPMTYVGLQFSRQFLQQIDAEQQLPKWLVRLTQEKGIFDTLKTPHLLRERAWKLGALPPANTLSNRLNIEAMALDWLADCLLLDNKPQPNARIDEAIDIIHREYFNPLTISQIAQRVGINACYLKQQFKQQTGATINAFITQTRLQAAQQLLQDRPDLSIKMVAALCGYQPAYFTTVFKKHHGLTPQQWQYQQN